MLILWYIGNVSVCVYPIQTLPKIFHYGYAAPFYNVSRAFRTIAFNTKNQSKNLEPVSKSLLLIFALQSALILVFSLCGSPYPASRYHSFNG